MCINAHVDIKIGNLLVVLSSSSEFSCLPHDNNNFNAYFIRFESTNRPFIVIFPVLLFTIFDVQQLCT